MKGIIYSIFIIGILGISAIAFNPVPVPKTQENLLSYKGKVVEIYEGGIADVVIKFENHETKYYINRGLQMGLNLNELNQDLLNSEIEVLYPNYWSPLDPTKTAIHVTVLKKDDVVLYTEIDC